jgi:hypothetical protein
MTPLRFDFDLEPSALPFCGQSPAARHSSWTGAQAAAITHGSNLLKLLSWFARLRKLTFADFCGYMGVRSQHSLCSTWAKAKALNLIHGTGEFYSYTINGRIVHREVHVITRRGLQAQFERLRARVMEIEGLSTIDLDQMETTNGDGGARGLKRRQKAVKKAAEELR